MPEIDPLIIVHKLNVRTLDWDDVQVYMDNILVKSMWEDDHLNDLKKTFNTLRSYNMKLNPNKCAFGVTVGKFLGFMMS